MAPLDQRMDTELLASPSFTHSADRTMPIIKSEQNVQETKSNLLFGCLDMFQFWSPCPSDSSPAKGNTDDHQSTSSRSSATEICDDDPQYTRISDPHLDVNSNPSHPIILQSIVSYPSSEAGVAGTPANQARIVKILGTMLCKTMKMAANLVSHTPASQRMKKKVILHLLVTNRS